MAGAFDGNSAPSLATVVDFAGRSSQPRSPSPRGRLSICWTLGPTCPIVKRVIYQATEIDQLMHALADPTRRQIVEQLGSGPASVSTLAAPLPMSLPAVVQHIQVLQRSGLVTSKKVGRVRTCRLEFDRLETVQDWIAARRDTWEHRLDRLGEVLAAEDKETRT
jgi:DNA-binding transcriptional ArsR family regulator